jgi:hypothetical protein
MIVVSIGAIGVGVFLSWTRISTASSDSYAANVGSYRANSCRVIGNGEKVELGATYFQPGSGDNPIETRLEEGALICDVFGGSARIARSGVAEHVINTSPETVNETLIERLKSQANPDSDPKKRIRRNWDIPIYKAPPVERDFLIEQLREGVQQDGN